MVCGASPFSDLFKFQLEISLIHQLSLRFVINTSVYFFLLRRNLPSQIFRVPNGYRKNSDSAAL